MTAATENRLTEQRGDQPLARKLPPLPVAAATHIFLGVLVALNASGYVVPASADPSLRVLGVAEEEVDNSTGAAGDLTCKIARGIFGFVNGASTAAVSNSHIGRFCYASDDITLSITNPIGTLPVAGRVYQVDSDGVVWIEVGAHPDQDRGASDLFIVTAADLRTKQNLFVALDSSGLVVLAATAGQIALGVLLNAPNTGAVAIVRRRGPARVIFSAAVAENALVAVTVTTGKAKAAVTTKCDASGASATAALTGSFCMGMTLEESTGDDDLALIDVHPSGALPGTLA